METQKQGVIPEEAETTKGLLGVQESSTRGKNCLRQGKNRTLRSQQGAMLPHVQNPLLLPPCTKVRLSPVTSRYQSLRSLSPKSVDCQTLSYLFIYWILALSFQMVLPIDQIVHL